MTATAAIIQTGRVESGVPVLDATVFDTDLPEILSNVVDGGERILMDQAAALTSPS